MPAFLKAGLSTVCAAGLLLVAACGGTSAPASAGGNPASAAAGSGTGADPNASASSVDAVGQPGAGQIDLCKALTTAQVEQALGHEVGAGTKAVSPGVGCGWLAPTPGNNTNASVLYVDPTIYETMKQSASQAGVTLTKVDDLGDESYVEYITPTAPPLLFVKKGAAIVSVSADIEPNGGSDDADQPKDLAAEKQLGAIVAGAL